MPPRPSPSPPAVVHIESIHQGDLVRTLCTAKIDVDLVREEGVSLMSRGRKEERFNDRCLGDSAGFVSDDKRIGERGCKLRRHGLFKFVNGV